MMTDPIADLLTRIRNANVVYRDQIEIPGSKTKLAIAEILKSEGFIRDYRWVSEGPQGKIKIFMKYGPGRVRVIRGLRRVSKPGRRVYRGHKELPRVLGGLGVAILSTPKGLLTDKQARKEGVGGEVLCYVW